MRTINIGGKSYPLQFNELAIEDFGRRMGHEDFSGVETEIAFFANMEDGKITFQALDKIVCLLHCAITEGCEIQNKEFELTEKQLKREMYRNTGQIIEVLKMLNSDVMMAKTGERVPVKRPASKPRAKKT